jgi:insulysin
MMKVVPFLLFSTAEAFIPHFLKSSSGQSRNIISATTLIAPVEIPPLLIETPANDDTTEYYQFVLPNGIPATIVRDLTSEKSSCSLAVGAGAQDDPDNRQGLAHFTEHAVFLGSKKFPEERAYKEFLSKNGGSSNAGTGMESTTYKFEVNSNSFSHSLDLFSQFFKDPLFTEDAIAREVMAVDAEDSKNRIIDGRRILQVTKNLMLQNHPYAKFSTGNVNTLASGDAEKNKFDVTKAMRKFHVEHYRPENMALSLVG